MKKQQGSVDATIGVVLVVALIGALGFIFWQNFIDKSQIQTTPVAEKTSSKKGTTKSTSYTPEIPDGWSKQRADGLGLTFATPREWTDSVEVEKFAVNENIVIFQDIGAIYTNYASESRTWTYYREGPDIPMEKLEEYPLKLTVSDTKAEGRFDTATFYQPAHVGPTKVVYVYVVKDGSVYRFALPQIKDHSDNDNWTEYIEEYDKRLEAIITNNITPFIKSISFDD